MKRPLLSALKTWSVGQLSLLILAGILSVWLMGAMAFGLVSNFGPADDPSARSVPTTSQSVGLVPEREGTSTTVPQVESSPAIQAILGGASFTVDCTQARAIARQSTDSFDCQVNSRGGFSQAVAVSCANLPRGLNCEPNPTIVTPQPNGNAKFKLALTNYDVEPGKHQFKIVASLPNVSAIFNFPFDTSTQTPVTVPTPAVAPRVDIECATGSTRLIPGQSITYRCTYSSELFYGTVATSCSGTPGITCAINPPTVAPRDGQPAEATLSLSVASNLTSAGNNQVIGVYGEPSGADRAVHKFTVDVPAPEYALNCAKKTADLVTGGSAALQCQVGSASGYAGPLHLKLIDVDPDGPKATLTPAAVQVGAGGTAEVNVSFESGAAVAAGAYRYALGVNADESSVPSAAAGDTPHNVILTVTVTEPSPPPSPSPSPSDSPGA